MPIVQSKVDFQDSQMQCVVLVRNINIHRGEARKQDVILERAG